MQDVGGGMMIQKTVYNCREGTRQDVTIAAETRSGVVPDQGWKSITS